MRDYISEGDLIINGMRWLRKCSSNGGINVRESAAVEGRTPFEPYAATLGWRDAKWL